MEGTGPPLVTPFDGAGNIDTERLTELVRWVEDRGIDFIVSCGSTSEAPLLTMAERRTVLETVIETATVPVIAGTGHPGLHPTIEQSQHAAEWGAAGVLVVTPFYYNHSQDTLIEYYETLADRVDLPVYLYSIPTYAGIHLSPETIGTLSRHENIHGLKDSSGNLASFTRTVKRADDAFDVFTGAGGIYAPCLDAGASGGILALANLAPERITSLYQTYHDGDTDAARELGQALNTLNHLITAKHNIPGLKFLMRARGAPAGYPRSPHREPDQAAQRELTEHLHLAEP